MKLRPLFILLAALTLSATVRSAPGTLIPRPQEATRLDGQFVFTTGIPVVYASGLEPLAEYIADYIPLQRLDDRTWTAGAALRLSLDGTMDDESYRLTVTPQGVQVVGADYGGVFNGLQTLLQLLPPEVYTGQATLPLTVDACRIEDAPRFHYRGMMLDVVRTWMDADRVKRHIDLLSHLKINKLHLLLSNDEGWRLEIKSHPELTEIGAWRGGDSPVMPVYGKWDEKYGGFYTQDEMRDLIRYAAVRNVEIIPELDLPGHSRNFARVHPEILCDYTPDLRPTAGYDYRSVWCASREENYRLLADILGELAALFPSEYLHIGGDEVDMSQWEKCPNCRALMAREGMADGHALEQYFLGRLTRILEANGKRPAVWNEAIEGGELARSTRVHGWESVKACLDATAAGYRTVVMPGQYFYFDMRQSPHEDGHDWAAIFDVRKTYSFDFARCGFTPAQEANVLGVEGAFFSELYVSHNPETPDYLDYMTFPRACALAELGWRRGARVDGVLPPSAVALRSHGGAGHSLPPDAAPCELQGRRVDRCCRRRFATDLHRRRRAAAALHRSDSDGASRTLPFPQQLPQRPQSGGGRTGLLPHAETCCEDHHVDGREQAVPLRTCRGVPRYRPHGAHLPEGRLDPLRFRRAARVPRTGGAYGQPATAPFHLHDGIRRIEYRRRDVRVRRRVGERRADDPPAVEADPCDPRRLDLRRQRLPLRDGAVARRQVNEEARRRFGGNPLQDSRRFFAAGRPRRSDRRPVRPASEAVDPAVLPFGPPRGSYLCYRMFRRPDSVPVGAMYNFNNLRR